MTRPLDLRGTPCPLNYVKTKLALEKINSGAALEVLLDNGEPMKNVPMSLQQDGHLIVSTESFETYSKVRIEKI